MATISKEFPNIQISHLDSRAHSYRYKQAQFHRLYDILTKSSSTLKLAIQADSVLTSMEADFEFASTLLELRTHYDSLDLEKDLRAARKVELGLDNIERTRPVGIVYIIPSKSSLAFSVLSALGAAIAAGACAIVELPQTLTQTSAALRKILTDSLDYDTFALSSSRPTSDFTRKCLLVNQTEEVINPLEWAQVLSSPSVAGTVAVVDRTANLSEATQAVAEATFGFSGGSAYAPQLVLVNEFVAEPFLSELVSKFARDLGTTYQKPNGHMSRLQEAPKESSKFDNLKTVVSGSKGDIVEILDRCTPFFERKTPERTILVHRISSLDDALNVLKSQQLAAIFLFAGLPQANYLSRFINADLCTINHIPMELLVGPVAPRHPSLPSTSSPRYASAMFTMPAPQYLPKPHSAQSLTNLKDQELLRKLRDTAMQPLLPIVRKSGHQLNFFGQAIFLGFGMAVTSIIGVSIGGLYLVLRQYRVR
ncbi:uncharacterized protein A1O9_02196 [Exophiala aquamarina CBS 119918]|uniref:Aldehyde dehydrogenase domain-containing protein n=1 Tax=Exophiala aquamarina CBS 119918 TaxID=1182545 RepID=A0A072PYE0_9EURO|nr:uncharacterized protein A1O9_02196 [Exophiala aquamarina CBS 119918]KEF60635.1 hypothetical protein A1O9_02196 [Exophiala aquamarina CBS 119918]